MPRQTILIQSPDDPQLGELAAKLRAMAVRLEWPGSWPGAQLRLLGDGSVFRWFLPYELGGLGWSERDLVRGYLALSEACLTTTFVVTQRTGAMQRIAASGNEALKAELIPDLASGKAFATVGISHLTTSRQHLGRPAITAREVDGGFILHGSTAWVTGATFAQHVVLGATLDDGRQILMAVPTHLPGVVIPSAPELVGLSASHTGAMQLTDVFVDRHYLIAGPVEHVMQQGTGGRTGGLQTSTLALGLSAAAIAQIRNESIARESLIPALESLESEHRELVDHLLGLADGYAPITPGELRSSANSLVLRASQAALVACKGAGYAAEHPAGRYCREALFFLVWSCPQAVLDTNLCELAGLAN